MKFGPLIEHNREMLYFEKSCIKNVVVKLVSDHFLKNQN